MRDRPVHQPVGAEPVAVGAGTEAFRAKETVDIGSIGQGRERFHDTTLSRHPPTAPAGHAQIKARPQWPS
ncbi:hypothetical protein FAGKG844_100137 [Frankia sp. AgKG'84/4]